MKGTSYSSFASQVAREQINHNAQMSVATQEQSAAFAKEVKKIEDYEYEGFFRALLEIAFDGTPALRHQIEDSLNENEFDFFNRFGKTLTGWKKSKEYKEYCQNPNGKAFKVDLASVEGDPLYYATHGATSTEHIGDRLAPNDISNISMKAYYIPAVKEGEADVIRLSVSQGLAYGAQYPYNRISINIRRDGKTSLSSPQRVELNADGTRNRIPIDVTEIPLSKEGLMVIKEAAMIIFKIADDYVATHKYGSL